MGKIVNQTELALIVGVSDVTLWEWQKDGMPVQKRGERGQANEYDTSAVIAWKIERELVKVRSESPRDALYRAQEKLAQIQIAEKERTLVPIAEAESAYDDMVARARQRLLQIPGTLPVDDGIRAQVREEIHGALVELAKYEPGAATDQPSREALGATGAPSALELGGGEALPR